MSTDPRAVATLQQRMQDYLTLAHHHLDLCNNSLRAYRSKESRPVYELDPDLEAAAVNFLAFHKNALHFVDAATKLINYESAKLSQVHTTRNIVKRFVMITPARFSSGQEWLAWVQHEGARLEALNPRNNVSIADLLQDKTTEDAEVMSTNE